MVANPILPGFHPDPSVCRVGDDVYVATSTFEWYPGVRIHHSRDLVNWRLAAAPLGRAAQLDMRGVPDSCGIWAPDLTYSDGLYWLIYTNVLRYDGNFKDTPNYLVTAPAIEGPWSDPVYLNASGFDPGLFHDDDGRKWLVNMFWDYRKPIGPDGRPGHFGGIVLQEYDHGRKTLVGEPRIIYEGTEAGLVEGPHLYRRDGRYYLLTAEGGTGYNHQVTMARADRIEGPYESDPAGPVVTSKGSPDHPLQRSGHGDVVEMPDGRSFLFHLTSRPLPGTRRSPLGRETALEAVTWTEDGWLRLAENAPLPALEVVPGYAEQPFAPEPETIRFDGGRLDLAFQWPRSPEPERLFSLAERPGWLRLFGRESPGSWFEQALVARRLTHHRAYAETRVDARPTSVRHLAGLTAYYDRTKFHLLALTIGNDGQRCLTLLSCEGDWPHGRLSFPLEEPIAVPPEGEIELACEIDGDKLVFRWREAGGTWADAGPRLDASLISDEAGRGEHGSFTGAFVGMFAHDGLGHGWPADFAAFTYRAL